MKHMAISVFGVLVVLTTSFFANTDAAADDKTCMLKALVDEVFVTVWDEDSGQDRQGKIFEGSLKSDELKTITSSTGYIVFSYKEAGDDRSYGNNHKTCEGGDTIHIP